MKDREYARIRYSLPEAAEVAGIPLSELCERIASGEYIPLVYQGDREIDDGHWITTDWVPILNPDVFSKIAGYEDEKVRVHYHGFEHLQPFDHTEARTVRIRQLALPAGAVEKMRDPRPMDKGLDWNSTFLHDKTCGLVMDRQRLYHLNHRQACLVLNAIRFTHAGKTGPIKAKDLLNGLFNDPSEGRIHKVFAEDHDFMSADGGLFTSPSKGYWALARFPRLVTSEYLKDLNRKLIEEPLEH